MIITETTTIEYDGFDVEIKDNSANKTISANVQLYKLEGEKVKFKTPVSNKAFILWQREEYDEIGNWTQKQAEKKIIDLLNKIS